MTTEKEIRKAIRLLKYKEYIWSDNPDGSYDQIFQISLFSTANDKTIAGQHHFYGRLNATKESYKGLFAGDPNIIRVYAAEVKAIISEMLDYIKNYYGQDLSNVEIYDPRIHTPCLNESSQTGSKD